PPLRRNEGAVAAGQPLLRLTTGTDRAPSPGSQGSTMWPFLIGAALLGLVGCGGAARLSVADGTGPDPVLPAPVRSPIPVVDIAPAEGWPEGRTPRAAPGLAVAAFAAGLDHPRWLYVLPNGDVLVA